MLQKVDSFLIGIMSIMETLCGASDVIHPVLWIQGYRVWLVRTLIFMAHISGIFFL